MWRLISTQLIIDIKINKRYKYTRRFSAPFPSTAQKEGCGELRSPELLTKIKTKFTENEQQIFVASFYGFLNYDSKMDFVIDLDDVWKWLKFSTKQKAKMLLENHFVKDTDYITSLTPQVKQPDHIKGGHIKGGHNKEIIMLNIATFKKFCLKAGTKKADEIHGRGTCVPPQTPQLMWCRKPMIFYTFSFQLPKRRGAGRNAAKGTAMCLVNYVPRGGVPKSGLIVNKAGKIVSKTKSVEELKTNRFGKPAE